MGRKESNKKNKKKEGIFYFKKVFYTCHNDNECITFELSGSSGWIFFAVPSKLLRFSFMHFTAETNRIVEIVF